jgi:uncharacterized membrane protein
MSDDLKKNIAKLSDSAKEYFQTKVDLIKLSLLQKLTKLTSLLINIWIIATLLIWILIFAAAAFSVWYGERSGNYFEGILIAGSFLLLVLVIFIVFRKSIINSAVLRQYAEILLDDENEEKI